MKTHGQEAAVSPSRAGRSSVGVAPASASLRDWIRLLRPRQWLKNSFVLAPLVFSGRLVEGHAVALAGLAVLSFCFLASGVYAWNDVVDREADRAHPTKRSRPVAAGRISAAAAGRVGTLLLVAGLALAASVTMTVALLGLGYVLLNVAYSFRLKDIVIVDVFALASFFVIRLLVGAAAIDVTASLWLILCGGLLALYLGFAKRRHELVLLGGDSGEHRKVLDDYSAPFLDQTASVLLAVTVVSYIMYTLTSDTATAVGAEQLAYSSVFVLYGVFRYLYLVHNGSGGNPAETLVTDLPLLVDAGLWMLYCSWVLYRPF